MSLKKPAPTAGERIDRGAVLVWQNAVSMTWEGDTLIVGLIRTLSQDELLDLQEYLNARTGFNQRHDGVERLLMLNGYER